MEVIAAEEQASVIIVTVRKYKLLLAIIMNVELVMERGNAVSAVEQADASIVVEQGKVESIVLLSFLLLNVFLGHIDGNKLCFFLPHLSPISAIYIPTEV